MSNFSGNNYIVYGLRDSLKQLSQAGAREWLGVLLLSGVLISP